MLNTYHKDLKVYPPAGSPILFLDILKATLMAVMNINGRARLKRAFGVFLKAKHVFAISSGRACLTLISKVLYELKGKKYIIIPAYTCYSVPASIIKAGLKIKFCDFASNSFDYDQKQLDDLIDDDVLAILVIHPYGFSSDIISVKKIAEKHGIYIIEDAAQSLGTVLNGEKLGMLGDIGFYSLSKGKNITSIKGGVVASNNSEIAQAMEKAIQGLSTEGRLTDLIVFIKSIGYYLFNRPIIYGFIRKIPFLKIGINTFSTAYDVAVLSNYASHLASNNLVQIENINNRRKRIADKYQARLGNSDAGKIAIPKWIDCIDVAPIRFPVFINDCKSRGRILKELDRYGASESYPSELPALSALKEYGVETGGKYDNGEKIASKIITLPTNYLITEEISEELINRIFEIVYE